MYRFKWYGLILWSRSRWKIPHANYGDLCAINLLLKCLNNQYFSQLVFPWDYLHCDKVSIISFYSNDSFIKDEDDEDDEDDDEDEDEDEDDHMNNRKQFPFFTPVTPYPPVYCTYVLFYGSYQKME